MKSLRHRSLRSFRPGFWIPLLAAVAFLQAAFPPQGVCQQKSTIKQKITMELDAVGDAKVSIESKLNEQQWQLWLSKVGANPRILERDLQHTMSAALFEEFKLDKDESSRSYDADLSLRGAATYLGNGKWEALLDAESDDIEEIAPGVWSTTSTINQGEGTLFQMTNVLTLPPGATNARRTQNDIGQPVLAYTLPEQKPVQGIGLLLIIGIVLAGLGLLLVVGGIFVPSGGARTASSPPSSSPSPPPRSPSGGGAAKRFG